MREKQKSVFGILLKKQITQKLSIFKAKKKFDLVGLLGFQFYLVLIVALTFIFLAVFSRFINVYCNVKIFGQVDFVSRQFELLSIAYLFVFILTTFSSIMSINKEIFENNDVKIMVALPISPSQLFWSKIVIVYAKQVLVSFIAIMAINVSFDIVAHQSFYYYAMSLLLCFIFPILSISIAALLALPVHFLKSFLSNKYIVIFTLISAVTILACIGYAALINSTKYLIISGEINFALNEATMKFFESFARFSIPANFFAGLVVKRNILLNLCCIVAISAICATVSLFIIKNILTKAIQDRLVLSAKPVKMFKSVKQKSTVNALISKEFNTIFRTPNYTFLYFAMAFAMPVMVGLCMSMGDSFIRTVVFAPVNFELALFLTLMFGVLTNTFCSTNISRDGLSFYTAKAMPVSISQIIKSKVILCLLVTVLSTLCSVLVLLCMSYINIWESLYILLVALLLSFAQICFATRLDFNKPKFSSFDDGEVKESNTTMSIFIIVGLIITIIIGFSLLYLAIVSAVSVSKADLTLYRTISKLVVVALAGVVSFLSYRYLTKNLTSKYYNFIETEQA